MKKRIIGLVSAIAMSLCAFGGLTACGDTPPTDPAQPVTAQKVSSTLLDGKIANLLSAQGLGVIDKTPEVSGPLNAVKGALYSNGENDVQKMNELAKQTENGISDIHFYAWTQERNSYRSFNVDVHHHDSVQCIYKQCYEVSDETLALESAGTETDTVLSLGARVNKLYTTDNFTFVSISSAVSGDFRVLTEGSNRAPQPNMPMMDANKPTLVNTEDHVSPIAPYTYSYIEIPAQNGREKGFITVKKYDTETGYHTANYWSDDYNQSYIIDNATGRTYSLSQFPYVYSVKGGIIKVHNPSANGCFDYYMPKISSGTMSFEKVQLPSADQFPMPSSASNINIDINGNILVETGISTQYLPSGTSYNDYGEVKVGNVIFAYVNHQVVNQLNNQLGPNNLEARRYQNAKRYHIGSDGKIYRVNFKGNFNRVSVNVLAQDGSWEDPSSTGVVSFASVNQGYIAWNIGNNMSVWDCFRITKIDNGYAYYSTSAMSDSISIFDGLVYPSDDSKDFVGVVKIVAYGGDAANSHKGFLSSLTIDTSKPYSTFLLGEDKMLYFMHDVDTTKLYIHDVKSGASKCVGAGEYLGNDGTESIHVENLGWISLTEDVDYETFGASNFSPNPVSHSSHFEAYYKLLTNN